MAHVKAAALVHISKTVAAAILYLLSSGISSDSWWGLLLSDCDPELDPCCPLLYTGDFHHNVTVNGLYSISMLLLRYFCYRFCNVATQLWCSSILTHSFSNCS